MNILVLEDNFRLFSTSQKMIYNGLQKRNPSEQPLQMMLKMLVSDEQLRAQSQRLAIARLKYRVNEMETRVEHDRRLLPPIKKVFDCVVDDTALCNGLPQLKRWVSKGSINVTIPFSSELWIFVAIKDVFLIRVSPPDTR